MNIGAIQQAFHQSIYGDSTASLSALISSDTNFAAPERIQVYRNNTLGTLKEVLISTYPVCQQLVGEKYFAQLANYYVASKPSVNANLHLYGEGFAECLDDLIQQRQELAELAYLSDMARLEWALHESYYAKNRLDFDFLGFAELIPQQQVNVCFELAADIFLLNSDYPVYSIWQQHQPHPVLAHDFAAEEDQGFAVVVREEFQPTVLAITSGLYQLLNAIQQGKSLGDLMSFMACSHISLESLIQHGWVDTYKVEVC